MRRIFVLMMVCGCGAGVPSGVDGETGGGSSSGSGGVVTTTGPTSGQGEVGASMVTTSGGSSGSSSAAEDDGVTFIVPPDGGADFGCDVYAQDCPRGEKCTAYANDGGSSWNDAKCVPVMEDPAQPGEPCFVVDSAVSGIDNCDFGAMCWDPDAENIGTCVALCTGTPEEPECQPGFICAVTSSEVLILCLKGCDPLMQDCPFGDDLCIGVPGGDGFLCVLDGENGQAHDPCFYVNGCDKGLLCVEPGAAVECDAARDGCCEPYCDLSAENTCPGVGQACVPYFEEGMAPDIYKNVGYCSVPM